MCKLRYYFGLFTTDRQAFWFQIWMVYNRFKINGIKWCFQRYSTLTGTFLTIHHRPIAASSVHTWSEPTADIGKVAILLQGPVVHKHSFTLDTVKLYKKHYPDSIIIVSATWTGESEPALEALTAIGAIIATSEKPVTRGLGNVNLQLASTLAGIQKAKELGAQFVFKTRSDQRMYAVNMQAFLYKLLTVFPAEPGFNQKYRIIASSFATLKYVPYLITDMFQFGHIDDMLRYWSAPYDTRTQPSKLVHTVQDLIDERMCESYLCSTYLQSIGRHVDWTIRDSWQAYAQHFCIVDRHTLDLFWYKYDFYQEFPFSRYDGIGNDTLLTFADWLMLYNNKEKQAEGPTHGLALGRKDLLPQP